MKVVLFLSLIVFNLMAISKAEAKFGKDGYLFDVSIFNSSDSAKRKTTTGEGEGKSSSMYYNVNLGKVSEKGYYYGGIYSGRSSSTNGTSNEGGSAFGLSVGMFTEDGYFVLAHYLVSATDNIYKSGSGFQLDGGFKFSIGNNWLLGGNLSYRSVTYTKLSYEDPTFVSLAVTELRPMLSLGYLF